MNKCFSACVPTTEDDTSVILFRGTKRNNHVSKQIAGKTNIKKLNDNVPDTPSYGVKYCYAL